MPHRVEYLSAPGERLVVSNDLQSYLERVEQFFDDTGLPLEDMVINPVVAIPLPITAQQDGSRKRLPFRPEMAWHPLFWLPLSVGLRFKIQESASDSPRIETAAEWSVRVITQVSEAGLFDPASGTWTDVLSTVGLDRKDPEVLTRVLKWQAGGADPDLDRIDLSPHFTELDESLVSYTIMLAHDLQHAQWAVTAQQVVTQSERVEQIDDLDEFAEEVGNIARIAALGFRGSVAEDHLQRITERLAVQSDPDEELDLIVQIARQLMEEHKNSLEVLVA